MSEPSFEQDELAHSSSSECENNGSSNIALPATADLWFSPISFMSSLLGTRSRLQPEAPVLNPTLKLEESKIDEELSW
jgi:hypothetical protein